MKKCWAFLRNLRRRARRPMLVGMVFCCSPEMCIDHLKMVRDADMTPLKPPSTINGPGAMVFVRHRGENRKFITVGNICGVRASLGADFVPIQSPTYRDELSKMIQNRFTIGADVLSEVGGEVRFRHIKKITVAFENPRIMTLEESDVRKHMHKRSQECREAIQARLDRGDEVTMVYSTLEGDLTYSVSWELSYDIDIQSKLDIVSQLAAKLGVGQSHITAHSITSPALIWGIIDDVWLAQMSITGTQPRNPMRLDSRIIPRDTLIDLNHPPLAPVVPSAHPDNARYRFEHVDDAFPRRSRSLDERRMPSVPE